MNPVTMFITRSAQLVTKANEFSYLVLYKSLTDWKMSMSARIVLDLNLYFHSA